MSIPPPAGGQRGSCRSPSDPTTAHCGPGEPSPAYRVPPSEISRYRFIGRFNGLSPPSRATRMIEWWKNSTGKAGGSRGRRSDRRRPVSDRQQRERRRTAWNPIVATGQRLHAGPDRSSRRWRRQRWRGKDVSKGSVRPNFFAASDLFDRNI